MFSKYTTRYQTLSVFAVTAASIIGAATVTAYDAAQDQPHLAQAWVAESSGDGLPGEIGKESYLYEDCPKGRTSDTCVQAHIWDYGASNCIKYEVNRGFHSKYSGVYYVKCDATDCCKGTDDGEEIPDIKKWDIGMSKIHDKVTYLGKRETTELYNKSVNADVWFEEFPLPFTKLKIKYTYYITTSGNETITHRIDFNGNTSGSIGTILYGNFTVQDDIASFRNVFQPPAACLKNNVLECPSKKVDEWNEKYFHH